MNSYTGRAGRYFLDTGTRFPRLMIWAMGAVKLAVAKANLANGELPVKVGEAIVEASRMLMEGQYDGEIVMDVYQTGSGTGLNMNVNEVIARHASEISGLPVHPNDDVNKGQSSNDVVPTAIRLAAIIGCRSVLETGESLLEALGRFNEDYGEVVRPGRTHLRDALPTTYSHWAKAYETSIRETLTLIRDACKYLARVPLGGTAVGTGVNQDPSVANEAIRILSEITGIELEAIVPASTRIMLMTDIHRLMALYKSLTMDLWRMMQDLRLMFSGPINGFNDIDLRVELPGSSMMPGKKNPVTAEAVQQAYASLAGHEAALERLALTGELELALGYPAAGYHIVSASRLLEEALSGAGRQLSMIVVDPKENKRKALRSIALVTLLAPFVGYDKASRIAEKALEAGDLTAALGEAGVDEDLIERLLDPERLVKPGYPLEDDRG